MTEVGDADRSQADMEELRIAYRKWQQTMKANDKSRDVFFRLCKKILK